MKEGKNYREKSMSKMDAALSYDHVSLPATDNPVRAAEAAVRRAQRDLDGFRCRLCKNVASKPVTTSCGHTFCSACLQ
eukprot:scaffold201768_cov18-Prasinocladus_malaysianus.AAC.1